MLGWLKPAGAAHHTPRRRGVYDARFETDSDEDEASEAVIDEVKSKGGKARKTKPITMKAAATTPTVAGLSLALGGAVAPVVADMVAPTQGAFLSRAAALTPSIRARLLAYHLHVTYYSSPAILGTFGAPSAAMFQPQPSRSDHYVPPPPFGSNGTFAPYHVPILELMAWLPLRSSHATRVEPRRTALEAAVAAQTGNASSAAQKHADYVNLISPTSGSTRSKDMGSHLVGADVYAFTAKAKRQRERLAATSSWTASEREAEGREHDEEDQDDDDELADEHDEFTVQSAANAWAYEDPDAASAPPPFAPLPAGGLVGMGVARVDADVNSGRIVVLVTGGHILLLNAHDATQIKSRLVYALTATWHTQAISGVEVCETRPLCMTYSKADGMLRLFNYLSGELVIRSRMTVFPMSCAALSPTGLELVVGFLPCLRIFSVLEYEGRFCMRAQLPLKHVTRLKFSHRGHVIIAVDDKTVSLIDMFSLARLAAFPGALQDCACLAACNLVVVVFFNFSDVCMQSRFVLL